MGLNIMNTVTLMSDGFIRHNGEPVRTDSLYPLSCRVILEAGYLLRSFFKLLEKYALLATLNAFFPIFKDSYYACPESRCGCEGIDYLVFSKTIEMIGFPEKRLDIYHSFDGICGTETIDIKSMQLSQLLALQIKLEKLSHVMLGDLVDILEFDIWLSMFEFLDELAGGLSVDGWTRQCEIRR